MKVFSTLIVLLAITLCVLGHAGLQYPTPRGGGMFLIIIHML